MHILVYLYDVIFRIKRESLGSVSAEYAFLIAFIGLVAVAAILTVGVELRTYFLQLSIAIADGTPPS